MRAAEALAIFCYQAKKWIGAFSAALGGLETLVFSGGIGENAVPIRARICDGLGYLGIELDSAQNKASAHVITKKGSKVTLKTSTFNAGPAAVEALFAGAIDATYIGPSPAINAWQKSNGSAKRMPEHASF